MTKTIIIYDVQKVKPDFLDFFLAYFTINSCSSLVFQVFRARTPPCAILLVSRLLEYTPSARITPLQACAHPFFDELREGNLRLPNGRDLPPLFNFTEHGMYSFFFY